MSNDHLLEQESNRSEKVISGPSEVNANSSHATAHWSLSTMLIWMLGPLACVVMANLWVDSVSRNRLPSSELLSIGFVATGMFYFLMLRPLSWLFSSNGVRFVSRILILLVLSFFLFTFLFAPRFFVCLWASVCLVSILYAFRSRWPLLNHLRAGGILASISMFLTVGVYLFSMSQWPSFELRRLQEMRAEHPIVDVSKRTSLLQRPKVRRQNLSNEAIELQNQLRLHFDENANRGWKSLKSQLRLVHDSQFERFVRSPGFGGLRMNPRIIRYAAAERLSAGEQLPPAAAHVFAYRDFFHPSSLGSATENPQHYTGFKPHSIFNAPTSVQWSGQYALENLELIGMLLHEKPVVYETDGLPNMETITAGLIPSRELTHFEAESLGKLQNGESLVIENEGEQLRMVGALRAIDQCSDCHQSNPGDLLGAFSYEFRLAQNPLKLSR